MPLAILIHYKQLLSAIKCCQSIRSNIWSAQPNVSGNFQLSQMLLVKSLQYLGLLNQMSLVISANQMLLVNSLHIWSAQPNVSGNFNSVKCCQSIRSNFWSAQPNVSGNFNSVKCCQSIRSNFCLLNQMSLVISTQSNAASQFTPISGLLNQMSLVISTQSNAASQFTPISGLLNQMSLVISDNQMLLVNSLQFLVCSTKCLW